MDASTVVAYRINGALGNPPEGEQVANDLVVSCSKLHTFLLLKRMFAGSVLRTNRFLALLGEGFATEETGVNVGDASDIFVVLAFSVEVFRIVEHTTQKKPLVLRKNFCSV